MAFALHYKGTVPRRLIWRTQMTVLDKPLHTLTAEDLMSREVVAIPMGMSLRGAALRLIHAHVSGAPVVDDAGRCVGVLSTADFLKLAGNQRRNESGSSCVCCDWQVMELQAVPEDAVRNYMTADLVAARADMSLSELARCMLDAHIHRVIVVDDERRPIGVVSTTDILATVAA
jgi:CBS domain-containing membrane protein